MIISWMSQQMSGTIIFGWFRVVFLINLDKSWIIDMMMRLLMNFINVFDL
jgi:hypothetical protein